MSATTIRVGGKPFYCHCGGNVFEKEPHPEYGEIYRCNSCGQQYEGDE